MDSAQAELTTIRTLFQRDALRFAEFPITILSWWAGDKIEVVSPCPDLAPLLKREPRAYQPGWACYAQDVSAWRRFRQWGRRAGKWLWKNNFSRRSSESGTHDGELILGDILDWLDALFHWPGWVGFGDHG